MPAARGASRGCMALYLVNILLTPKNKHTLNIFTVNVVFSFEKYSNSCPLVRPLKKNIQGDYSIQLLGEE